MDMTFITELLLSTIRMATPLLLCALGEMFGQKAGMLNIGLDGIMTFGAFFSFLVTYFSGNMLLGVLSGAAAGIVINLIYGFCTITLNSQQIVNGMGINLLAPAVATFVYKATFGISASLAQVPVIPTIPIPVLSKIPVIGPVLFNHNPIAYLTFLLVPLCSIFFSRTKPGLNLRGIGEYPRAMESIGVNVIRVKYLACIVSGLLAGLGGTYLSLCYIGSYSEGMVAGRGFIALSAVIFGRWTPVGIMLATLLFGFADAIQLRIQVHYSAIPFQLLAMLPYLLTLFALIFSNKKNAGPNAVGKPYFREQK